MRFLLSLVLLLACTLQCAAQNFVSRDFSFLNYLIDNNMRKDAMVILASSSYAPSDTLDYMRGWAAYSFKLLPEASASFAKVPRNSSFYAKSTYFNVVCLAHSGDYGKALATLENFSGPRDGLYYTELAGLHLLNSSPDAYISASKHFSSSNSLLTEAQDRLAFVYGERYLKRKKSPFVAGLASAVLPGAGYWYAGDKTSALLSFFTSLALAGIAIENNVRHGPEDWRSILADIAGAGFYLANIYGSVHSISVRREKIGYEQTTTVLYNIHMPLRSIFK